MSNHRTAFQYPVGHDAQGSVQWHAAIVDDRLLPVMASIIESATAPVLLEKTNEIRIDPSEVGEEMLAHIRLSVAEHLRAQLRDHAIREGLAVITEPVVDEYTDGGMLAFRCTATAIRLVDRGLSR